MRLKDSGLKGRNYMAYTDQTMENFEKLALEKDVVLFGAGSGCMRFMNRIGDLTDRIKFIFDSDNEKQGGKLYGVPIEKPEKLQLLDIENTVVVITANNDIPEIYEQILSIGNYIIMTARILISDVFSTVAKELYNNRQSVHEVYELLYDAVSKKIYEEVIKRRMLYGECNFSDLIVGGEREYRLPMQFSDLKPVDEVILDCGAYTGDTLKIFIDNFGPALKKVYAFECGEDSLKKLKETINYLRNGKYVPEIVLMPCALSDHEGKMLYAQTVSAQSGFLVESRPYAKKTFYESNYAEVKVSTIDNLIPENEKVTMIKMDIEGSEYEALLGAKRVIQRCKPRLAISIYHNGKDYYRLPLLVKKLVPEYKIAIRHYKKNHVDTDMYCWI